jgi:predicted RNA binding protein YcfA (HicA-like mRNA interferase family)
VKPVSGKRMCKILESHGWTLVRKTGSHFIYSREGASRPVPVPVHADRDMHPRTQKDVMRQAGLTDEDL